MENIVKLDDLYFETLGAPKPGEPFNLIDDYRFQLTYNQLMSGSVLDVGVYFGDFLKLARKNSHKILGTEINQDRVDLANSLLNENVVKLDFRNGKLLSYDKNSVENVVCTEVVEHVPDHKLAISELCRVAQRNVIITVPFSEKIQTVCCLHCNNYTPHSGHLHSYDLSTFQQLLPNGWRIKKQIIFGNKIMRILMNKLNFKRRRHNVWLVQLLDKILPGKGFWLMVVLHNKIDNA